MMKFREEAGYQSLDPRGVMGDLMIHVEFRFGEAARKQDQDPYSVWFTSGTDPATGEYLAWCRLGESTELSKPNLEIIDIGLVLRAAGIERPEPLQVEEGRQPHFYVEKPLVRHSRMRVSEQNSLSVIQQRHRRLRHGVDVTPISNLSYKLEYYHLQSLRVRHKA